MPHCCCSRRPRIPPGPDPHCSANLRAQVGAPGTPPEMPHQHLGQHMPDPALGTPGLERQEPGPGPQRMPAGQDWAGGGVMYTASNHGTNPVTHVTSATPRTEDSCYVMISPYTWPRAQPGSPRGFWAAGLSGVCLSVFAILGIKHRCLQLGCISSPF